MTLEHDELRTAIRARGRWGRLSPATKAMAAVVTVVVALGVSYLCWIVMYETVMKSQISTAPQIVHSCPAASATQDAAELPVPSSLPSEVSNDVVRPVALGIGTGVAHRDVGW